MRADSSVSRRAETTVRAWKRWVAALLAIGAAAVGHWGFWYSTRARPAALPAAGPAPRLLADPSFPVVLWVPWPHQNLGWLRRVSGLDPESWVAVARLAGLETDLPSFGPLAVAPASELVVARSTRRRWTLRTRVFPAFAGFARLSGRIASNPWLSGGAVRVEGDAVRVDWEGRWWSVEAGAPGGRDAESPRLDPVLALLGVSEGADPLPPGRYGLRGSARGLELRAEGRSPPALLDLPSRAGESDRILTLVGDPGPAGPRQLLALHAASDPGVNDLPRAVRAHRVDAIVPDPWSLPGGGVLRMTGRHLPERLHGGWSMSATDGVSLVAGADLVDRVAAAPEGIGHLHWALWVELGPAAREVARLARIVDELPFFGRRTRERWRDARTVVGRLSRSFSRLTVVLAGDPDTLWLRLEAEQDVEKTLDPAFED